MKLNTLYKRNTQPSIYKEREIEVNCGSFALDVDEWYCPYIQEDDSLDDELRQYSETERIQWIEEMVYADFAREDIMEAIIIKDFEFILKTCSWLLPINREEIVTGDRVIAYRLSLNIPDEREEFDYERDTDFHFRVLLGDEWWEKNGGGPIHFVSREVEEDPWVVEDWLVYDGPVRYAKFKRE